MMPTITLIAILVALVLASVDAIRSDGHDLTAWGVVILALVLLWGRL